MESGLTNHQLSEELDQQRGSRHSLSNTAAYWLERQADAMKRQAS